MNDELSSLSFPELLAAISSGVVPDKGDSLFTRLAAGKKLQVETPFTYPGRQGPVIVELAMVSQDQVRLSDKGMLLHCLAEQGIDAQADMVISRTVFHAAKQFPGAGIYRGQFYVDCRPDDLAGGLWSFLQMVVEIIGLRHCKYKDALVQFERRRDTESRGTGWRPS